MKLTGKLLIAELAIVVAVGAAIAYIFVLPSASYHFQRLTFNIYTDGRADFSTDATALVRGLGGVALLTLLLGLAIGAAIGLSLNLVKIGRTSFTPRRSPDESMNALLKSGFVKPIDTEGHVKFEITATGQEFMQQFRELDQTLERETMQKSPMAKQASKSD